MPLFRRPDGDLVKGLSHVRRIIPYLMKRRNESVVYHEQIVDLSRTLPFIAEWNRTHDRKVTIFHLTIAALGRVLHERPGLNRFVSNSRIYQRKGCYVSFAAKQRFADDAPLVTVKQFIRPNEPFAETVANVYENVDGARAGKEKTADKEVKLALLLPHPILRLIFGLLTVLDRWNLMPKSMIDNDPMYASLFLANLGSIGIDRTWHHLYEYGTVSLFVTLCATEKMVCVESSGPVIRDTVRLRYSFDERINDGFYCAKSLRLVRDYLENPERLLADAQEPRLLAPALGSVPAPSEVVKPRA